LCSISIESGNDIFAIENDFLIDIVHHKLIPNSLNSSKIRIPVDIEILGSNCFSNCKSLSSITFESNSHLKRIESASFSYSSLQSILIPRNVEILGSKCFSKCKSLSSITFESNSHLTRIESEAFHKSSLQSILIPPTILFIASDAVDIPSQIRVIEGDSCPEFDRWLYLNRSGVRHDFRRIERLGFGLRCLKDYFVNLSVFVKRSMICECQKVPKEIYDRIEDECLIVMKSITLSESIIESQIETEIEKLINVHHPCIARPIGFIVGIESGNLQELKIVRLYLEGSSLSEVLSVNPLWWTSTVKAKVIAGLVLGLRFAHSLGLVHGHLTGNNILFDFDHCIQIVDFKPIQLEIGQSENERFTKSESEEGLQLGGFSGEGLTREKDIEAFASILFEVVVGRPANGETSVPANIPTFVSSIIESGLWLKSKSKCSFHDIFEILKENDFLIEDEVDSAEVSGFVSWVESAEDSDK
jgi:hypothetical protein